MDAILDLTVLLGLFLTVYSLQGAVIIEVSVNNQWLAPGDEFEFRCQVTNKKPDELTQVMKTKVDLHYDMQVEMLIGMDGVPWEICNGTMINPHITSVTQRYGVTKGDQGNLYVRLRDAQPEDSGYWGCRVISDVTEELLVYESDSHAINVTVIGPILDMGWGRGPSLQTLRPLEEDAHIRVTEATQDLFVCTVQYTNVQPNVKLEWVKDGQRVPLEQHLDYNVITNSHMENVPSGLIRTNLTSFYFKQGFFGSTRYNGWQLVCSATLQFHDSQTKTLRMEIRYPPTDLFCTPSVVAAPVGTPHAQLVCKARGNPLPEVEWRAPADWVGDDQGVGYTTDTEIDGDVITATYRIEDITEAHYGSYHLLANNEYGSGEAVVRLLDHIPSHASGSALGVSVVILSLAVYTCI